MAGGRDLATSDQSALRQVEESKAFLLTKRCEHISGLYLFNNDSESSFNCILNGGNAR